MKRKEKKSFKKRSFLNKNNRKNNVRKIFSLISDAFMTVRMLTLLIGFDDVQWLMTAMIDSIAFRIPLFASTGEAWPKFGHSARCLSIKLFGIGTKVCAHIRERFLYTSRQRKNNYKTRFSKPKIERLNFFPLPKHASIVFWFQLPTPRSDSSVDNCSCVSRSVFHMEYCD